MSGLWKFMRPRERAALIGVSVLGTFAIVCHFLALLL